MSTLGELLRETPQSPEQRREESERPAKRRFFTRVEEKATVKPPASPSIWNQQIEILVQNLFLRPQTRTVRRVAFASVEASGQAAQLCLDIARALASEGRHEVGLIDATVDELPLPKLLQIPTPTGACAPWAIGQRLWLAPRESWCSTNGQHRASEQNIQKLRELTTEFDFSIVHSPPVSWLSARIGQACDGLVLVLTAGQTRQLVATQVKQQLSRAQVHVLGVVLAERQFPVPERLYRSL
jgi:Mrp family chromosome partitioning ATPase